MSKARTRRRLLALRRADARQVKLGAWAMSVALNELANRIPIKRQWWPV
jgi:hypothetical protein